MPPPELPHHLRLRGKADESEVRRAMRAVLTATHLLGLATGRHLAGIRGHDDRIRDLQARVEKAELRAALLWELLGYLVSRFARLPEHRRPHFAPEQRFRILAIKNALGWNAAETSKVVLQCPNTILNWERHADPEAKTVGSCLQPTPPVRRIADVTRHLVQHMSAWGFGGGDLIARTLAAAGWRLSPRTVHRIRKERVVPPAPGPTKPRNTNPVVARFVHHTWMLDVSEIRRLLGGPLYMAAVFDAFSRMPLAVHTLARKPNSRDMARLLRDTVNRFGAPRYVITDLGSEFKGAFIKAIKRIGARRRTASADSIKATARLERFWLTLKELARLRTVMLPIDQDELDERLARALTYYACFRPHEGLEGATPAEAFLGLEAACLKAVPPPRGRPGQDQGPNPFGIGALGDGLPYLVRAA